MAAIRPTGPSLSELLEGRVLLSTTIYASDSGGNLLTIDASTGKLTTIGHMSAEMLDIALSHDGQLFGIDGTTLYRIDKQTAASSPVGALGASATALGFADDGTLYAGGDALWTVSPSTGATTLFNPGQFAWMGDIAFDNNGTLFLSRVNDYIDAVDRTTGLVTNRGFIEYPSVSGLAYDRDADTLYGVSQAVGGPPELIRIDRTGGVGHLIAKLDTNFSIDGLTSAAPFTHVTASTLVVEGTSGDDNFSLSLKNHQLHVSRNGSTAIFGSSSIRSIQILCGDGKDVVT